MSIALHATCFDASALVKRYIDEPGHEKLRAYWNTQATRYTTPFCLYETLGALKVCKRKKMITKEGYLKSASDLVAWFRASDSKIQDIEFTSIDVFHHARELADHHDLDLSDAFQLLSLHAGYFAGLIGGSRPLLVTADEALAKAARSMGLPVWDCLLEPVPAS